MSPRYLEDWKEASPRHFRTCPLVPPSVVVPLTSSVPLSSLLKQLGAPRPPPQTVVLRARVPLPHIHPSSLRRPQTSLFSPLIHSAEAIYPPAIPVAPLPPCHFSTMTHANPPNRNLLGSDLQLFRSFSGVSKRTARVSSSACASSKTHAPDPHNTLVQEASRGVAESAIPPAYLQPVPPGKVSYQTMTMTSCSFRALSMLNCFIQDKSVRLAWERWTIVTFSSRARPTHLVDSPPFLAPSTPSHSLAMHRMFNLTPAISLRNYPPHSAHLLTLQNLSIPMSSNQPCLVPPPTLLRQRRTCLYQVHTQRMSTTSHPHPWSLHLIHLFIYQLVLY